MLTPADTIWPQFPNFARMMTFSTLEGGLGVLKRPFILSILTLYGSFSAAGDAAGNAGRGVGRSAAGSAAKSATYNAAESAAYNVAGWAAVRAAGTAAGGAASTASWGAAGSISRLPKATSESIGRAAAEGAWKVVIEKQPQIQDSIGRITFEDKDFDPIQIINGLLQADLTPIISRARCYYLYQIWKMLQVIPENEDLSKKFNKAVEKYECKDIFSEVPGEPLASEGLNLLTSRVGEDAEKALRTLVGEYLGRPPNGEEMMQRLLQL